MDQPLLQFGPDVDAVIADAVAGRGALPWPMEIEMKKLLWILAEHKGAANPIQLRDLVARTGFDGRVVKAMVRSLVVDFEIPIGASRAEPAGYFVATNATERLAAARPYIAEIRKLASRVKALIGGQAFVEELGQMRMGQS